MIEEIVSVAFGKDNPEVKVMLYGSMAYKLAIEQSDVDLAVVGFDFKGIRSHQIQVM
jgi:predicted nucleotidyltransferase